MTILSPLTPRLEKGKEQEGYNTKKIKIMDFVKFGVYFIIIWSLSACWIWNNNQQWKEKTTISSELIKKFNEYWKQEAEINQQFREMEDVYNCIDIETINIEGKSYNFPYYWKLKRYDEDGENIDPKKVNPKAKSSWSDYEGKEVGEKETVLQTTVFLDINVNWIPDKWDLINTEVHLASEKETDFYKNNSTTSIKEVNNWTLTYYITTKKLVEWLVTSVKRIIQKK